MLQSFRLLSSACMTLAATLAIAAPALAADYPERPVNLIVGFPPGGGNDVLARLVASQLQADLGQPFVVENRPGAQGFIAFGAVKNAAPDGYTLLIGPSSGMTVNPAIYRELPYDAVKDFAPVSLIGEFPLVVTVHPTTPYQSLPELIEAARQAPGAIDYASAATSFQLATEMFAQQAGVEFNHIPYKGSAQAVTAVLGQQVPLTFADSAAVTAQIRDGSLRALAVTSRDRVSTLPDVPTVSEAGLPGFNIVLWSALFAPAGTPDDVIQTLQRSVAKAMKDPAMQERLASLGVIPVGSSSQALADTLSSQIEEYTQVAKTAKISVD
ncbi:MAG: tripartite tricarboxylate transporter substrate binding protein [Pigmentiphaga sp.]|nr:tripartite tricarboxylate transporter substrate binding protein [Pigmentiphaga sp.]